MIVEQKWRKLCRWLRREFPTPHPANVRRVRNLKEVHGDTELRHGRFLIRIARQQSFALTADTLLHEWAHALTQHNGDQDDHGRSWGMAYARLYRAFLAWQFGKGTSGEQG